MASPEPSHAIYYAIDAAPRCLFEFRHSVASVRRHCPALPMYVALAGEVDRDDRDFMDAHQVAVLPTERDASLSAVFLKWQALAHGFRETDVLYLDADTIAFDDVSRLFESQGKEDFHARRELACEPEPSVYPHLLNAFLIGSTQVDHRLFDLVRKHMGAETRPVWNTGVMLFRNGLAGRLAGAWPEFARLARLFRRKRLPYPCTNPHILEEIVTSLALGAIHPLTWALLPPIACAWFTEYMGRDALPPIVLHTWDTFYPGYLCHAGDREALRTYLALPIKRSRPRIQALWLKLGTGPLAAPEWVLDRWVQVGARTASADPRRWLNDPVRHTSVRR